MKALKILVFAVTIFSMASTCFAVVGPVHVVLNCRNTNFGAARANLNNAFTVYVRYNVDLKVHDSFKIWFPSYEAASTDPLEIVKNACDGLPKIDEKIMNPRFIPNEKYFEKFNNPELQKLKQLYVVKNPSGDAELIDLPDTTNIPNWGDPCDNNGKYPLMAKDPSGLGCWMLGTVMPSMPIDFKERFEKIHRVSMSVSIGYQPCDCQPSIVTNTCKERSLTMFDMGVAEGWRRGYNPIDLNTSRHTGIISPMTPGRYKVAVATTPEPEPIESEAFVLPCSDVLDVKIDPYPIAKKPVSFSVFFKTGEGGALDFWDSTIKLKFPKQFKFSSTITAGKIYVNSKQVSKHFELKTSKEMTEITFGSPVNIENFGNVRVDFDSSLGVSVDYSASPQIEVSTSSEPNYVKSEIYALPGKPSTVLTEPEELIITDFHIKLPIPEELSWKEKTNVTIGFPKGFAFQKINTYRKIIANGAIIFTISDDNERTLSFESVSPISKFLAVHIPKECKIINGNQGKHEINIKVGDKSFGCGEFELTESKLNIDSLEMQHPQAGIETMMSFLMKPSSKKPLKAGDTITVIFPEGTKISADNANKYCAKVDNINSKSVQIDGHEMTIILANDVGAFSYVKVEILCPVTNPRVKDNYVLRLRTSQGEECSSEPINLDPAPLKSLIYFKDPEEPNCDGWFNKPPILGFDCLNPDAKITFWFNNQPDKEVIYGGEARMMPGQQRAHITWQSEFNGVKEEPQTIQFNLDTIAPPLTMLQPRTATSRTNKKSFTLKGERGFTEMLTDGDNTKYQVVDSVFIRINGEETQLLEGEIYETEDSGSIKYEFEKTVDLKEGENIVEIIGRDQACNETDITKTIILDTVPPQMTEIELGVNKNYTIGEPIQIKVKTESNCLVTINKDYMAEEATAESDVSTYTAEFTPQHYLEELVFTATDQVGNTSTKTVALKINPKQKKIVLTLDSKEWAVDGIPQVPFTNPPTSRNLPKELAGNTYIPIRNLANIFGVKVEWDQKTKKITLTKELPDGKNKVVQMWDKQPLAMVNGVKTKIDKSGKLYPAIINGVTMIPLRFTCDVFGAGLVFDSKTGRITITYPGSVN